MSSVPSLEPDYSTGSIREHLESLRAQNCYAPTTLEMYGSDLRRYHFWLLQYGIPLFDAKALHIINYLEREHRESKPSTKSRCLTSLSGFYNSAIERGYTDTNPVAGVPRPRTHWQPDPARLLSRDELVAFLKIKDPSGPFGIRNWLMVNCLACGISSTQLTGLTEDQLDLSTGTGPMLRYGRTHKRRQVSLPMWLAKEIQHYGQHCRPDIVLEHSCDYVFPSNQRRRLTRARLSQIMSRNAKLAGIARPVVARDLRLSYEEHMLPNDVV